MSRKQILTPALAPLLACGFLVQSLVPMLRIMTTYQVLEHDLGAKTVGLVSAVFALLPMLLAIQIGRLNDRGGVGPALVTGSAATVLAALVLWLAPAGLATFLVGNAILGIGQTLVLSALQLVASRVSSRSHRDAVLGNYMVAISTGQAIGPLVIGLADGRYALVTAFATSVLLLVASGLLYRRAPRTPRSAHSSRVPLSQIVAMPGLWWVILLGSVCVAAQDLILAFLPLLGIDRGLSQIQVGILLSIRAMAAIASRLLFGQAVRHLGRMRLTLLSALLSGLGMLTFVLDLPLWALALSIAAAGFGLGITLTSSVALTMMIAPVAVRGTALSLRLTANRLAQFSIPLAAGAVVAPLGAAGVFGLCGATLLGVLAGRPRRFGGGAPL